MDHLKELRQKPIWVNYIRVWNEKKQGYNKPPINPKNLYNASPTNPDHWTDYQTAARNVGKPGKIYQNGELIAEQPIEGVGLILARPLTGIDFDHVRDPETGEVQPFAKKIIEDLDSYTEISPSGTGLHILILDDEAEDLGGEFKNIAPDGNISESGTAEIDAYNHKRYFTLTGNMHLDKPIRNTSGALRKILQEYSEKKRKASGSAETEVKKESPSPVGSEVSEENKRRMIESALDTIPPEELDFGGWAAIGSALKQLGFSCGIWEDWSQGKTINPKHVNGYTFKRWNKLKTVDEPERLIIGVAKRFGWSAADTFTAAERWSYGRNLYTPEERAEYGRRRAAEGNEVLNIDNLYLDDLNGSERPENGSEGHDIPDPYNHNGNIGESFWDHWEYTRAVIVSGGQKTEYGTWKDFRSAWDMIHQKDTAATVTFYMRPSQAEDNGFADKADNMGLITYENAVDLLLSANDKSIEIPKFESFAKVAKIGLHDSVVIAGETGAGKSMLAINFMENLNDKYPIAYFNLEMTREMVLRRLISIHTGLELDRVEGYKNDPETQETVNQALQEITNRKPIHIINDRYRISDIEQAIQTISQKHEEPLIVFIDHTLLVKLEGVSSGYERFTGISEELRRIALLNNCILFILTQQSRAGKANKEEEPELSSLKESGSFENDATQVCFLWYSLLDSNYYLVLRKNRKGESECKWLLEVDKVRQIIKAPGLALPLKALDMENITLPESNDRPTRSKRKKN